MDTLTGRAQLVAPGASNLNIIDSNQNIFYSSHKSIKHSFTIDAHEMQSKKLEVNETLPTIFLGGNDTYYYIKGEWYTLGVDNTLFREYHSNHL